MASDQHIRNTEETATTRQSRERARLRPGQNVRWRNPHHAHILGWADAYGPGPFAIVGVVDKADLGIPAAVVLKTSLGDREINEVWLAPVDEPSWQGYDPDTLTGLLDG